MLAADLSPGGSPLTVNAPLPSLQRCGASPYTAESGRGGGQKACLTASFRLPMLKTCVYWRLTCFYPQIYHRMALRACAYRRSDR
jgi:hypothetical protein